ncbi:hypothetical protein [Bacillus sp. FJAT-28004]|uniref:hypothetical protein n=1 Tax=Bacillus sp. FJAT-28004 TaxID=1679165 RepID=UPI0006B562ED|nr:hypothetical protein [Bacillus sp. FJAT-28004]
MIATSLTSSKSLDDTRLVISNAGWEHVKSDIYMVHDYECREEILKSRYDEGAVGQERSARKENYRAGLLLQQRAGPALGIWRYFKLNAGERPVL